MGRVVRTTILGPDSDPPLNDAGYCTGRTSDKGELVETVAWQSGSKRRWPAIAWLSVDPMEASVRDHLIRRLSLPGWMRDGAGLEPWQSAGLIACAAAGVVPRGMVDEAGAGMAGPMFPFTHDVVAMLDADTMVLPWPGGPRV